MEMETGLPEAGESVMEPELPLATASLKVNTIFVDGDTLLLPRAGLYVVIVGATVSVQGGRGRSDMSNAEIQRKRKHEKEREKSLMGLEAEEEEE